MSENFNWKRLCLIGVLLIIVVLLLHTYRVKVYVGDISVKYAQILEYLENNFEGLDFKLDTKLFNNSTTDYYDCLMGYASTESENYDFLVIFMPVTGAPIPFSKTKGWNIELTLAKDYFLANYLSSNTEVIQKITQKGIPESAVLLSKSARKVYYSPVENLFYEEVTGGNVVLVSTLYVEDEAIWETMQSNLTTGWYIVK